MDKDTEQLLERTRRRWQQLNEMNLACAQQFDQQPHSTKSHSAAFPVSSTNFNKRKTSHEEKSADIANFSTKKSAIGSSSPKKSAMGISSPKKSAAAAEQAVIARFPVVATRVADLDRENQSYKFADSSMSQKKFANSSVSPKKFADSSASPKKVADVSVSPKKFMDSSVTQKFSVATKFTNSATSSATTTSSTIIPSATANSNNSHIAIEDKIKQLKQLSEKREVSKLRERWETATKRGTPLKPLGDSFSQNEEITNSAINMLIGRKPVVEETVTKSRKDATKEIAHANSAEPDEQPKSQAILITDNTAEDTTKIQQHHQPPPPPKIEIHHVTPTPEPPESSKYTTPTHFESSIDINSYTEDTDPAGEEDDLDSELDTCLDEAISAATLAAQKSMSRIEASNTRQLEAPATPSLTPMSTVNPSSSSIQSANGGGGGGGQPKIAYTVSLYRQMQKQHCLDSTPVKTVVKPPSGVSSNTAAANRSALSDHMTKDNSSVFIRAREYDEKVKNLNKLITVEQDHIYQASQAINFCRKNETFRGSGREVDAHEILLVATERRKAYQEELDRINQYRRQYLSLDTAEPRGTLTVNYISLSLKREFVNERINSLGEYVYYFICLLKFRDQLLQTQYVDSDAAIRAGGRVEFSNYISLVNLPHDFNVEVSVFALQTKREELSHEQKFNLKGGQTLKSKQRPFTYTSLGGPGGILDTNFRLVGKVNLTLGSTNRQKFALQGFQYVAPIDPNIHLKTRCCAETMDDVEEKGFLHLYENVNNLGAWRRLWCLLKRGMLRFWEYPDDESIKEPISVIDLSLSKTERIYNVRSEVSTRPNTFELKLENDRGEYRLLLSADNKEDFDIWSESLNRALHNLYLWNVPYANATSS